MESPQESPQVRVFDIGEIARRTQALPPVARAHAVAIEAIFGLLRAHPPMVWQEDDDA